MKLSPIDFRVFSLESWNVQKQHKLFLNDPPFVRARWPLIINHTLFHWSQFCLKAKNWKKKLDRTRVLILIRLLHYIVVCHFHRFPVPPLHFGPSFFSFAQQCSQGAERNEIRSNDSLRNESSLKKKNFSREHSSERSLVKISLALRRTIINRRKMDQRAY